MFLQYQEVWEELDKMILIQFLIIILAAFLIGKTLVNFQKQKLDLKKTIFWIIIWAGLLIIAVLPEIMGVPAEILGITRSVDVFVYVGIIILFYLMFVFFSKIETQRERITKLTRILAIQGKEIDLLLEKSKKTNTKQVISKKTTKKKLRKKKK